MSADTYFYNSMFYNLKISLYRNICKRNKCDVLIYLYKMKNLILYHTIRHNMNNKIYWLNFVVSLLYTPRSNFINSYSNWKMLRHRTIQVGNFIIYHCIVLINIQVYKVLSHTTINCKKINIPIIKSNLFKIFSDSEITL